MENIMRSRQPCRKTGKGIDSSISQCSSCFLMGATFSCSPSGSSTRRRSTPYLALRLAWLKLETLWLKGLIALSRFRLRRLDASLSARMRSSRPASTTRASIPSSSPGTSRPTRSRVRAWVACSDCSKANCRHSLLTYRIEGTESCEHRHGTGTSSTDDSDGS